MTTQAPNAASGDSYPGQRLGLNAEGPRSIARFGRRVAALFIDWSVASLVNLILFGDRPSQEFTLTTTVIFGILQVVAIPTLGASLGQLLLRMRVISLRGGWIGLWRPVVRTVLLCLVIPALIWDADQRGLHDRLAGSVLIRV